MKIHYQCSNCGKKFISKILIDTDSVLSIYYRGCRAVVWRSPNLAILPRLFRVPGRTETLLWLMRHSFQQPQESAERITLEDQPGLVCRIGEISEA